MFLKHGVMEGQDVDTDNSHELGGHGVSAEWVRSKIRAADVAPERAHKALQTAAKKLSHADRRLMRDDSDENVRAYVKRNAQVVALENKRGAR